jgi:SAM-dependent methyltransferase
VPENYDRYLGPLLFEPYARDLAARLPPETERVLELACGTGILTRRLRESLPDETTIVATDLNEAMVAYAREAVPGSGIEWQTADMQALQFAGGSFDAVCCQFGFMFLPDRPRGFAEARRVLRPEGILLANVWCAREETPALETFAAVLERLFPDDPPTFFDTPYGYHDEARLVADLRAGGWERFELETVTLVSESSSAEDLAAGFVRGSPLSHELAARGADPDEVVREVTAELGNERPFRPRLSARVIVATA